MPGPYSSPQVTTVIPTFRRPKLVAQAIHSVLRQSYPNLQVCVYDNASGDETESVVSEIAKEDPRVKYYCHPKNIGAIANFNFGMQRINTPFFTLLGDDNTFMPTFFEDAIHALQSQPKADAFVGATIRINENGDKLGSSLENWPTGLVSPPEGLLLTVEKGLPLFESVFFRKTILDSVGILNPSFGAQTDFDFLMKIGRKHGIYVSNQHYATFLHHDNRLTHKIKLQEIIYTHKIMFEQWSDDEDLSREAKQKIQIAWKTFVKRCLSTAVYERCILQNDPETLTKAIDIMKKEIGYSYRPYRNILVAKLIPKASFFKKFISKTIPFYIKLRKSLSN